MNTALIITSIISLATLIVSIYNARTLNENKEKDRRIAVVLSEKRRMHNDLFEHITKVLDLGRRCSEETDEKEKQKMRLELLNHKIFIWINLDRDNRFSNKLREHSNSYIFHYASYLESTNPTMGFNTQAKAYDDQREIMKLIDKYIEEENKLIAELM
ncbi:hypothetical protein OCF67_28365 [Bacillus wiedmannii]|uniref:hypothetical protein n=1 Tax=Bacillus wiedmannii TaxID=1890302 RepID=UPI0021CE9A49|nr:hypothetical protein [Bacillus wiedmannii]MCU5708006.1 hypothetical protein [Bacillus wiedmannii]